MNLKWTRSLLATTALVLAGSGAMAGEINFTPVPFAATDAQKRAVLASEGVEMNGQTYPIGFNLLARSGDKIGDAVFGTLVDQKGQPVLQPRRLGAHLGRRRLLVAPPGRRQAVQHHPLRIAPRRHVSVRAEAG